MKCSQVYCVLASIVFIHHLYVKCIANKYFQSEILKQNIYVLELFWVGPRKLDIISRYLLYFI